MEEEVLKCLRGIRAGLVTDEYTLHDIVQAAFDEAGIPYEKEFKLGSGSRVDYMVNQGIAVEIKKGKPNRTNVIKQLTRYAAFDRVKMLVLVVERNMDVPETIEDKPCVSVGLNKNWGIAL